MQLFAYFRDGTYAEKQNFHFPFKSNEILSCSQFYFCSGTKWNFYLFKKKKLENYQHDHILLNWTENIIAFPWAPARNEPIYAHRCVQHLLSERLRLSA